MTLSGSSVYRGEDSSDDERLRDRSPLRTDDRRDTSSYGQADPRKQKLTFGVGKKSTPAMDQKKGIQIKLGSSSVILSIIDDIVI